MNYGSVTWNNIAGNQSEDMNNKRVTIKDIAAETGYSANTISHALRGINDIPPVTRDYIIAKAREMGYIFNSLAGALRTGHSGVIAILISDIINPYVSIITKEIQDELFNLNYGVMILDTDENADKEKKAIKLALGRQVDGMIICPAQQNSENIKFLLDSNVPFVLFGRRFYDVDTDYVILDDFKGVYSATEHLIRKGCTRILCLSGPLYISPAKEKYDGFKKAIIDNGMPFSDEDVVFLTNTIELPDKSWLLNRMRGYDAVVATNDVLALYVAELVMDNEEFANLQIFGFDNIQSRLHLPYKLNTVNTAKAEMSRMVCNFLINRINDPLIEKQHYTLDTSLCIRE